jgi:hypothetical protein
MAQNASWRRREIGADLSGKVHQKTARKCTKSGGGNSGENTKNRIADFMKRQIKSAVGSISNSAFVWALSASCLLVLHLQIRCSSELRED